MDAFFASIEQRDNEAFRGKPLAVGYAEARGVVAAASYEARRYGVRSAMPSKTALKKCPHLIFTHGRYDVYKSVSNEIMEIFHEYTDLVEPLSLDEAFLDVTENRFGISSATEIAKEIKQKIFEKTNLTASAGVSYNKFLAKIASDFRKPNGLFIIRPKDGEQFVETLEIERFFGVGKVTAEAMHQMGIKTGSDLKQFSEAQLTQAFGKAGHTFYLNARGIDDRLVEPDRERKSMGAELTFEHDIDSLEQLQLILHEVAEDVIGRIDKRDFIGRTVTLKIKYADFQIITRSKTGFVPITTFEQLYRIGLELLAPIDTSPKVRLLGLTIKRSDNRIHPADAYQLKIQFEEWKNER
ncbi:MAG: DNA-directed polymerase [Bacteroidetes bacterium]|nr:DNA-directed polymerase [Bacteroidota bacterium]